MNGRSQGATVAAGEAVPTAAAAQARLAAEVFRGMADAVLVTDRRRRIIMANDAFQEAFGYRLRDVLGDRPRVLHSGRHNDAFYRTLWRQLLRSGGWRGEVCSRHRDGSLRWHWLSISRLRDSDGQVSHYIALFHEMPALSAAPERLEYLANHDELTGLPNRSLFRQRLRQGVAEVRRDDSMLAVLFVDLDNFKNVNDSLGHDVGDHLLKQAAQRLQQLLRDVDTVARIGGDEFAVLLHNISPLEASEVSQRVIEQFSRAYRVEGRDIFTGCSIGISLCPKDSKDSESLLKHADAAMYQAKAEGKGRYRYYSAEFSRVVARQMELETALRRALEQNLFAVYYQPQLDCVSGELKGAEALLRWHDPELGEVSPAEFIPVAERSGVIGILGLLVGQTVVEHLVQWQAAGFALPDLSINVSPHQLKESSYIDWLSQQLQGRQMSARQLVLEMTEGTLLQGGQDTSQTLKQLARLGFRLSLDDFGTGYSSLAYLKRFPVAELKVDRSFVRGIETSGDERAIVEAIIGLAQTLGLRVVAEGVETAEQWHVLQELGCDLVQGFYMHRPMAEADFRRLLRPAE